MIDLLQRVRGWRRESVVCECRRCGTTLDSLALGTGRCPYCGRTAVVCFDVQ